MGGREVGLLGGSEEIARNVTRTTVVAIVGAVVETAAGQ